MALRHIVLHFAIECNHHIPRHNTRPRYKVPILTNGGKITNGFELYSNENIIKVVSSLMPSKGWYWKKAAQLMIHMIDFDLRASNQTSAEIVEFKIHFRDQDRVLYRAFVRYDNYAHDIKVRICYPDFIFKVRKQERSKRDLPLTYISQIASFEHLPEPLLNSLCTAPFNQLQLIHTCMHQCVGIDPFIFTNSYPSFIPNTAGSWYQDLRNNGERGTLNIYVYFSEDKSAIIDCICPEPYSLYIIELDCSKNQITLRCFEVENLEKAQQLVSNIYPRKGGILYLDSL